MTPPVLPSTVATAESLDVQRAVAPVSTLPWASRIVAVSATFSPTCMLLPLGDTLTDATAVGAGAVGAGADGNGVTVSQSNGP